MSDANPQTASLTTGDPAVRSLVDQLRAIWKHRFLVLAIAAATTALVALWTLRQPKIYQAVVSLEFDPNPPRPLGREVEDIAPDAQSYWLTREYYVTQLKVIESQRVAEAVVRQLGLQHDADFLGVPLRNRRNFRSVDVATAAAVLRGRTRVELLKDSRLVYVRVEDVNPRRAQLLANTIASVYIRQNLEKKLSTTVSALEWLGQQLESLRAQLERSENALHDFRRQNNLLSVSFEDRRNHVANRIQKLSEALTDAQTRRIQVAARVMELRRAVEAENPLVHQATELLTSQVLQSLRERYEETRRERDALATRYGRNSQQMLAVESRLQELADAIRHEVRNIVSAAEGELRGIRRVENELRQALLEAQQEGLELNLREIQYGRLLRERENNAKLYGIVLERTKETDLTRLLRVNNVRVLDDALLPTAPIRPKVTLNVGLGLLGGVVLGVLVSLLLIQADRTVRSQTDVEEHLRATFLGVLPRVYSRGMRARYRYGYRYGGVQTNEGPITNVDLVVHTHPSSPVAEACRVVRTNLLFMSPDEPWKVLMVASAEPRDGKTLTAVSLAVTLAQSGKKVLLVDADLRRPRIHKIFGVTRPVGITSVLVNEATLEEAIVETEVPNLSLLPCGPIPPNPAELLHSQRFHDALKALRTRYDRVVFDTPPIGAVTDALVIGPQVDGVILVVRARKTLRARAGAVLAQLRSLGARVAGVVLNDVDLNRESEAAYYYYSGGYDYRSQNEAA